MSNSYGFQVGEADSQKPTFSASADSNQLDYAFDITKQPMSTVYYNDTALIVACRQGNLEEVQLILCMTSRDKKYELVNFRKKNGATALNTAVEFGHLDVISYLVNQHNAIIHPEDLVTAIKHDRTSIAAYLLECNIPILDEAVFQSAKLNRAYILDLLTKKLPPEKFEEINENGHTPLHVAASNDHLESVKVLVDFGVDLNKRASFLESPKPIAPGYRAVDFSATKGYPEVTMYLMSKGAKTGGSLFFKSSANRARDNGHPKLAKAINLYNEEISSNISLHKKEKDLYLISLSLPTDNVLGDFGLRIKDKFERKIFRQKLV